eukprot:CAMPEP_0197903628 /NCGR_PEP_ID=MMETSP1439-20131203/56377_1 /TAXON_ID=66791 /ORGANISM="Gonyaulax spinifera, Strain CCMP409" /LENGTH=51 /DNA_ID=CAMNT_0043524757 /DNA_START=97 /DNA_END=249 /DNA_ORIENTATION=-
MPERQDTLCQIPGLARPLADCRPIGAGIGADGGIEVEGIEVVGKTLSAKFL